MSLISSAALFSPIDLCLVLQAVHSGLSRSALVFVSLVTLVAAGWLFAILAMASKWKPSKPIILPRATILSVSAAVVIVCSIVGLAILFGRLARTPAHTQKIEPLQAIQVEPPPIVPMPTAETVVPRPVVEMHPGLPAVKSDKSAALDRVSASSNPSLTKPKPAAPAETKPLQGAALSTYPSAITQPQKLEGAVRNSVSVKAVKSTAPAMHGPATISNAQVRVLCADMSLFAGEEVYIKWKPGAKDAQLASQISRVLDCARVTVTYAAEAPGLEARGVSVGSHANEGQTTDRIRPFADAIAAALKAQGFKVAQVTGSHIPANQTAIFIGTE